MFTRTTLSFIIASLLTCSHSITGQFDHCLRPSGCHGDDCCFNVVSKTGPICDPIPGCAALFPNDCCRNARPVHTDYGIFYGYAIQLDTAFGYEESGQRYLEIWRGIPYARPPTRENNLRFRRPVQLPQGRSKYDATYFRDDCPQPDAGLTAEATVWTTSPHEWARRVPLRQTEGGWHTNNEDCLYMNIYVLNETTSSDGARQPSSRKKLPVLVVFDGMDHLTGTGNRYPGHALAQLGLVVVFVNYRLGPFGYLATDIPPGLDTGSDDSADVVRGNYALWDQVMALKFIRENIHLWLGDKNQVTVLGHGSAAADVALHLLSTRSGLRDPPLFHRAVLLSGADQMEGGFIQNPEEPMAYTVKLAQQVGCDAPSRRQMLDCLRARTASELATAAGQTRIHRPNWRTKPWAPTMDGDFLTADPKVLWESGQFAQIPLIGGLNHNDGSLWALSSLLTLNNRTLLNETMSSFLVFNETDVTPSDNFTGLSRAVHFEAFRKMTRTDFAMDPEFLAESLIQEYTDWSNPDDPVRRWAAYSEAWSDRLIGSGLIRTLRYHSQMNASDSSGRRLNRTQFYVFAYQSPADPWTPILGSYWGSQLPFLFGLPRLALRKTRDELELEWPRDLDIHPAPHPYSELDRNMTDYMLFLISNFVKSGNATPISVRNLTWDSYRPDNRTYLWLNLTTGYEESRTGRSDLEQQGLGAGFGLRQNFRVQKYAYWNRLYTIQLEWQPRFSLPMPTPAYVEHYQIAALSLSGILAVFGMLLIALLILWCRRRKLLA